MQATITDFRARAKGLLFNSPIGTFYAMESMTALFTALPIACIVFLIKGAFS